MRVFILRYEMYEDLGDYSKCFNTPYSAYFWVDKNRLGMKTASLHLLCTVASVQGMIGEKLVFYREFDEEGRITARIPEKIPYYEEICEKLGEANDS